MPSSSDAIASLSSILTETLSLIKDQMESDKIKDDQLEAKLEEKKLSIDGLSKQLAEATQAIALAKASDGSSAEAIKSLGANFSESLKALIASANEVAPVKEEVAVTESVSTVIDTGATTST